MMRFVTIGPNDHQLAGINLFYLCRSGCLRTGHAGYSTSSTGASKVRILT